MNVIAHLIVALLFSFLSHKFGIAKSIKAIPLIATAEFLVYALWPFLALAQVYTGLSIGIFVYARIWKTQKS